MIDCYWTPHIFMFQPQIHSQFLIKLLIVSLCRNFCDFYLISWCKSVVVKTNVKVWAQWVFVKWIPLSVCRIESATCWRSWNCCRSIHTLLHKLVSPEPCPFVTHLRLYCRRTGTVLWRVTCWYVGLSVCRGCVVCSSRKMVRFTLTTDQNVHRRLCSRPAAFGG